jgi:hypothetical protein
MSKPRCSECDEQFEPDMRSRAHQKTCSVECRDVRRARQARERRWKDIEETRKKECKRQRRWRNGGVDPEAPLEAPTTPAVTDPGRVSRAGFEADVVDILGKILKRRSAMPSEVSRAGFERQTLGMLRELAGPGPPRRRVTPGCHAQA